MSEWEVAILGTYLHEIEDVLTQPKMPYECYASVSIAW